MPAVAGRMAAGCDSTDGWPDGRTVHVALRRLLGLTREEGQTVLSPGLLLPVLVVLLAVTGAIARLLDAGLPGLLLAVVVAAAASPPVTLLLHRRSSS